MAWADVAVTAAGSTCWELCYAGLPALVTVLADNQRGVAAALADAGAVRSLGAAGDVTAAALADALAARYRIA
jgi:spore coat polysaccharide biosynthesis predicted glycosyltransferase SpsG